MDEIMLKTSHEPSGHLSTEQLSLALDGLLDSAEQQAFDNHVQACEPCRRQWLVWSRISNTLQIEPFSAPAPGFMLRVDQAIQRDEKRRERLWGGVVLVGGTLSIWTVLLIGLALALTVGITIVPDARPSLQEYVGYGQRVVTLAFQDLTAVRDGVFSLLPGPAATAGLVAALALLILIWLRLVRSSGRRPLNPPGQRASTDRNQL